MAFLVQPTAFFRKYKIGMNKILIPKIFEYEESNTSRKNRQFHGKI